MLPVDAVAKWIEYIGLIYTMVKTDSRVINVLVVMPVLFIDVFKPAIELGKYWSYSAEVSISKHFYHILL